MKLPQLTGWQRLGVALTVLWLVVVLVSAARESFWPAANNWIRAAVADSDDPLGLFPRLVMSRLLSFSILPVAIVWLIGSACSWVMAGFASAFDARYVKHERLADTLALIQVLALDEYAHRSDEQLQTELQGKPKSSETWTSLADEHPEFFRVNSKAEKPVSLIARHVVPKNQDGARPLPTEHTTQLLQLAIELHDRQVRRAQAWQVFIPMLVAVIAGVISLIGILLSQ